MQKINGEWFNSLDDACKKYGVSKHDYTLRRSKGYTSTEAITGKFDKHNNLIEEEKSQEFDIDNMSLHDAIYICVTFNSYIADKLCWGLSNYGIRTVADLKKESLDSFEHYIHIKRLGNTYITRMYETGLIGKEDKLYQALKEKFSPYYNSTCGATNMYQILRSNGIRTLNQLKKCTYKEIKEIQKNNSNFSSVMLGALCHSGLIADVPISEVMPAKAKFILSNDLVELVEDMSKEFGQTPNDIIEDALNMYYLTRHKVLGQGKK